MEPKVFVLDGSSLTCEDLYAIRFGNVQVKLSEQAWEAVEKGRQVIDDILISKQVVYGINTGFGNFANVRIPEHLLEELQQNLIRSHAAGVGPPLPIERARMLLALRINVLAKGFSGISRDTLSKAIDALNASCLAFVPEKGTVGASGDLAPLAHLALGLMGEGKMWDSESLSWEDAAGVLSKNNLTPIKLTAKEGLALINGTQLITALGTEALCRSENIVFTADIVTAMTLEVLKGTTTAYSAKIHDARPHAGQIRSAALLRNLLHRVDNPSEISMSHYMCGNVQDSYTLRCVPQVHGIVYDTIAFVKKVLSTEINSATDNPMVFSSDKSIVSGGNFHGEYPAKVLDFLAIAVHELSSISERRIERLVNSSLSNLPAFLVREGGLNSGFMIAHCTAAALVSENKVLCHPSSIDSLSTSAAKEDHVSMGGFSARKSLIVVENVETVVAIELLCACQGLDFLRPLKTTKVLEKVHALVRSVVPHYEKDKFMKPDIDNVVALVRDGKIAAIVKQELAQTSSKL